jgi:hypothetical protein
MPRRVKPARPSAPILPALDIRPDGVYLPNQVIEALKLRASSLRSEWRAGRLRIVRRCGKNYVLGRDLLRWLDTGELPSPASRRQHNGPLPKEGRNDRD